MKWLNYGDETRYELAKVAQSKSVKNFTGTTEFWLSVPNIVLALVTFEMATKLFLARDSSIAGRAVNIVRFPRLRFLKITLHENSRNSAIIFKFAFVIDSARMEGAKKADSVTRVSSKRFSSLGTYTLLHIFLLLEPIERVVSLSCNKFSLKVYKKHDMHY